MDRKIIVQEPRNYRLWYVPKFPIAMITTTPLETPHGTPDRYKMVADVKRRGMLNPVCVWNHASTSQRPGPRPYYLKIGYNRLWVARHFGWTHFAAFVAEPLAAPCPIEGASAVVSAADIRKYWTEGTFIWGVTGPASKPTKRLEYYYEGE